MKKQLLIAAVAATMASVSMADVSISGGATANINSVSGADTTYASDIDLKIVGKAGATTATVDLEFLTTSEGTTDTAVVGEVTHTNFVKNAYISTNIAGANIKVGDWYGSDSLLGNGTNDNTEGLSVDYTMSGVKVQYEAQGASDSVTISGTVGGVAISHEIFDAKTDTKFSGSAAGVAITYRKIDADANDDDQSSLEVSTEVSGCYNDIKLAKTAQNKGANYVAFGALFPSSTKPNAPYCSLEIINQAKKVLTIPIVGIGGIDFNNQHQAFDAGCDAVAMINALFQSIDLPQDNKART